MGKPRVYASVHIGEKDLPDAVEITERSNRVIEVAVGRMVLYFHTSEAYEHFLDLLIEGRAASLAARDFVSKLESAG